MCQVLFDTEWHKPNDGEGEAVLARITTHKLQELDQVVSALVPNPKYVPQPWRTLRGQVPRCLLTLLTHCGHSVTHCGHSVTHCGHSVTHCPLLWSLAVPTALFTALVTHSGHSLLWSLTLLTRCSPPALSLYSLALHHTCWCACLVVTVVGVRA